MKKTVMIGIAMMVILLMAGLAFATEETLTDQKTTAEEKKVEVWKPTAEASVTFNSSNVGGSGAILHEKPFVSQPIMVGMDKNGKSGVYVKAENFSTSEREPRETDFYAGAYAKFGGMNIDLGVAEYWMREKDINDCYAIYVSTDFPALFLGVIPFINMEYDFSEKVEGKSMDGLFYRGGLKREFKLHERVSLAAEISLGGNTGVYGLPAENLAFARESVGINISLTNWLKINGSVMTQQILGLQDGIAKNTDRPFVSGAVVISLP